MMIIIFGFLGNDDKPGLCRFNRSTGMFKYFDLDPDKSDDFVFEPNGLEFMNKDEIWLRSVIMDS